MTNQITEILSNILRVHTPYNITCGLDAHLFSLLFTTFQGRHHLHSWLFLEISKRAQ